MPKHTAQLPLCWEAACSPHRLHPHTLTGLLALASPCPNTGTHSCLAGPARTQREHLRASPVSLLLAAFGERGAVGAQECPGQGYSWGSRAHICHTPSPWVTDWDGHHRQAAPMGDSVLEPGQGRGGRPHPGLVHLTPGLPLSPAFPPWGCSLMLTVLTQVDARLTQSPFLPLAASHSSTGASPAQPSWALLPPSVLSTRSE